MSGDVVARQQPSSASPAAAFLLWHHLRESARKYSSRPAVVWGETVLTYGDLDAQSNRVATLLEARGIVSGIVVRQATRTLLENEEKHIRFLNAKILNLLNHFGFPRNPAIKVTVAPGSATMKGTLA